MAREGATSTVEYVGIAVAVVLLVGGIGAGMRGSGGTIAGGIGDRLGELVAHGESSWSWRTTRERRSAGGTASVRVSRDDIRMSPLLPPLAAWSDTWTKQATIGGAKVRGDLAACALCASLDGSYHLGPATGADRDGGWAGFAAGVNASARLALASVEATGKVERRWGAHRVFVQGRVRATAGGEADLDAELLASRSGVAVEGEVGAMAGAVARAEANAGVDLLGVAIRQSAKAEGWAGAGLRGSAGVRYEDGAFSWKLGWGAALGFGGAAEWRGQVDATQASPAHRRLARDSLATSLRMAGVPFPILEP